MKYKLFPLLLCTLALPCQAALITLIPEPFGPDVPVPGSITQSSVNPFGFLVTDENLITTLPQVGSTNASWTNAFAQSLYSFTDTQFSASWTAALYGGATARTSTFMAFMPTVDLRYELQGSYAGFFTPGDGLTFGDGATFYTVLGWRELLLGTEENGEFIIPFLEEKLLHDGGLFHYSFSSTGILPAGRLAQFSQDSALHGLIEHDGTSAAAATGSWTLKLSAVPDGGSTLAMFGFALSGLSCFIRQRI
jgi:VPDSG-CTERM motif